MTILDTTSVSTSAERRASTNFTRNLGALWEGQARVAEAIGDRPVDGEWVLGRDGYLTLKENGQWLSGCSVPRAAAEVMLESIEASASPVHCFLCPSHAGQVRVALDQLPKSQAVIVVVPAWVDVRKMLGCDDFSEEISSNRLWIVAGETWGRDLEALLTAHSGLPTPGQFIRTKLADANLIETYVAEAQAIFSRIGESRAKLIEAIRGQNQVDQRGVCVLANQHFGLWQDAGDVLSSLAIELGGAVEMLATDDAYCASPVALAQRSMGSRMILTSNLGRADLPKVVREDVAWVTWATSPRVPGFVNALDGLIVADASWRELALRAGWPESRVVVGGWPKNASGPKPEGLGSGGVGMVCDTLPVQLPKSVEKLSSHRLVWELIEAKLKNDPFALSGDAADFVGKCAKEIGVDANGLNLPVFLEQLVLPLYQQGIARALLRAGLPVKVFGKGWEHVDEAKLVWRGPIDSRQTFERAIGECNAIVYAWPMKVVHPTERVDRTILYPQQGLNALVSAAKMVLKSGAKRVPPRGEILTVETLRKFMPG